MIPNYSQLIPLGIITIIGNYHESLFSFFFRNHSEILIIPKDFAAAAGRVRLALPSPLISAPAPPLAHALPSAKH